MIISRTPFKISLFGGGTDYPEWYRESGGSVLAAAINKYCYITTRHLPPFFDYRYRVVYSQIELAKTMSEIKHPAVRAVVEYLKIKERIEIHHDGDLPAKSGIGANSTFTVGLLNALYALGGEPITKNELATRAIDIERNILKSDVGSQDQIIAAFGGLNRIDFCPDDTFKVTPVNLSKKSRESLEKSMILFYLGLPKTNFSGQKIGDFKNVKSELAAMQQLVDEGVGLLLKEDLDLHTFGKLLHESWQLKKIVSGRMSEAGIEDAYQTALTAGAIGGKMLGSGGGGFLLFIVKPESRTTVLEALSNLIHIGFSFDTFGSRIVAYDSEDHISSERNSCF